MTSSGQLREDLKRLARFAANIAEAHTAALFLPGGTADCGSGSPSRDGDAPIELKKPLDGRANPIGGGSVGGGIGSPIGLGAIGLNAGTNGGMAGTGLGSRAVGAAGGRPGANSPINSVTRAPWIELSASHSLSQSVVRECKIPVGSGLIGWVAENGRPIHVAPFDLDSSSLGLYTDPEPLKSLIALPISVPPPTPSQGEPGSRSTVGGGALPSDATKGRWGVLVCDSRKAYSFNKLQIKHLEDLAAEVSRILYWALASKPAVVTDATWESFVNRSERLAGAIGLESIEILRISIDGFPELEERLGLLTAVQRCEQFVRLVQQALPPHFPLVRLPSGEVLVAVDNMMSTFFQNKVKTLADHLGEQSYKFAISVEGHSARAARVRTLDLDAILRKRSSSLTSNASIALGAKRA